MYETKPDAIEIRRILYNRKDCIEILEIQFESLGCNENSLD